MIIKQILFLCLLLIGCSTVPAEEFVELSSSDSILHISQESSGCRMTQNTRIDFVTNVTPGYVNNRIEWRTHVILNNSILPSVGYLGSQIGPSIPVMSSLNQYTVNIGFGPYPFVPESLYLLRNNETVPVIIELCNENNRCIRSPERIFEVNLLNHGECTPSPDYKLPDLGNY